MLPGMELMGCSNLAVPAAVMQHVVHVESSFNPYAIGVVGARLARQPQNLSEALSTVRMLERKGYNFSLGLAQVNRHNLARQGLNTYEKAFEICPNLLAGSRILAECYSRSNGDWGKAFSCYYSGNFVTGFRHGYVQKVLASWRGEVGNAPVPSIPLIEKRVRAEKAVSSEVPASLLVMRRVQEAATPRVDAGIHITTADAMPLSPDTTVYMPHAAESGDIESLQAPVLVRPMGVSSASNSQDASVQAAAGLTPIPSQRRDNAFVF